MLFTKTKIRAFIELIFLLTLKINKQRKLNMFSQGIFRSISIRTILYSPNALRDPRISLDQLMISIKQQGLINPVVIRPINYKENDNYDHYELIAGYRRLEACKRLGWQKISCHIVDVNEKEAYEISLTENVQQKTMSPIEEGRAFRKYVETFGWGGESDLAGKIGKSQEYISKRIKLLSLPESLQKDIAEGKINVSTAEELFPINDDQKIVAAVQDYIVENDLTKREARQIVRVVKDNLKDYGIVLHDRIGLAYDVKDLRNTDDGLQKLLPYIQPILKQFALAIRLSLHNMDEAIEDLDSNENLYASSSHMWIMREILMQHRLRLHEQMDILLKQLSKIKNMQKTNQVAGKQFQDID